MAAQPYVQSNGAASVVFALCLKVGRMRFFGGVENSKIAAHFVRLDCRRPFCGDSSTNAAFSDGHTKKFARICCIPIAHVLSIYAALCVSKVGKSVVGSVSVDMVNLINRPLSGHVQPRKAMPIVVALTNSNHDISAHSIDATDSLSWHPSFWAWVFQASKHARFGIVMKKLAQTLRGKIGNSHDALQLLIGQRPWSVSALPGLRYFTLGPA